MVACKWHIDAGNPRPGIVQRPDVFLALFERFEQRWRTDRLHSDHLWYLIDDPGTIEFLVSTPLRREHIPTSNRANNVMWLATELGYKLVGDGFDTFKDI